MEAVGAVKSQEISGSEIVCGSNSINLSRKSMAALQKASKGDGKESRREGSGNIKSSQDVKIKRIAEAMENYVQSIQTNLKIQVRNETGDIIVKVISKEDGKLIRQIPPEQLLDLAAAMESMTGVLFNENI